LDHGDSDIVYPISSHKEKTVVYAYLSTKLANIVKSYPNVIACIPDQKLTYNSIETIDEQQQQQQQQIQIDVKNETHWKDVNIRENADLHLSLLSQGKFNKSINERYDTSYYYPSTAGQDIDIYVVDTGFNFRHPEFSNKEEREAKCLYYINFGGILKSPHEDYCYGKASNSHGMTTSDVAAGLTHGVASKANIYGIVIDEMTSDLFVVLQYIKDSILRPNKTVFNLSLGIHFHNEKYKELIEYWEEMIDSVTEAGAIIITAAGNDYKNIELIEENKSLYPCSYKNVICVGAIDNYGVGDDIYNIIEAKKMKTKYYRKAPFSNYEKKVDIFAPGYVVAEFNDEYGKNIRFVDAGTSFSTPIVSGVVACLMSENPYIKFNIESMRQYLQELGEKNILDDIPEGTPNIFINNGKHIIYPGDDEEDEEETEYEIEVDYDKPINYYDSDLDSDFDSDVEEYYTRLPEDNEYPNNYYEYPSDYYEYPSDYYEYPSDYYEYPSDYYEYPGEYPTDHYKEYYEYPEYEKPTDYVHRFEEHDWEKEIDD